MATQIERTLRENFELEYHLNDRKAWSWALLENFENDRNLWNSERGLLCQKNKELSTESESLKTQLNENKGRLVQMEDEKAQNDRVLEQFRKENTDLQNQHADLAEAKKCLANRYESLHTELNRCTLVSDENVHLHNKIRKLETALDSLKRESMSNCKCKSGRNCDLYDMLSII